MNRFVSIFLLMIFAVISAKNLMPLASLLASDCGEFAHIHVYQMTHAPEAGAVLQSVEDHVDAHDGSCHEGKSFFGYLTYPPPPFEISEPLFSTFASAVFSKTFFENLDLEPLRKPPRFA